MIKEKLPCSLESDLWAFLIQINENIKPYYKCHTKRERELEAENVGEYSHWFQTLRFSHVMALLRGVFHHK